jgi:anthranilate 1,2-dioxygenase ferredoxin subunit
MSTWHAVATVADLQARKKKAVDVDGTPVALFYLKGKVYALNDICIHEQRNLSKGSILFGKIICPGHQWKFDPATGEPEDQEGCQPTYPVQIDEAGVVSVSLERAQVLA